MDSMAKMRPGIFTHRYVDFGNFQQCLDVMHSDFVGQYSLIQIIWNSSDIEAAAEEYSFENFVSAICYPSTCTKSDIESIFEHFKKKSDINVNLITIETAETYSSGYSPPKIAGLLILLSLFGITHLSTTLCFYFGDESMPKIVRIFDCGSAWQKLTSDTTSDLGKRLEFFHGIKVLYLIGAILIHLYIPIRPLLSAMYLPEIQYFQSNSFHTAISKIAVVPASISFVIG